VHVAVAPEMGVRPGDVVHTTVTYAAPHHLNADGPVLAHRRTRAGDAWEAASEAGRVARTPGVSLGMPTIGAPPATGTPAAVCGG
jgi:tRNA-2-methylthio-N6-dimethylallyladenosine synthase